MIIHIIEAHILKVNDILKVKSVENSGTLSNRGLKMKKIPFLRMLYHAEQN